jgi:hypothetical protein
MGSLYCRHSRGVRRGDHREIAQSKLDWIPALTSLRLSPSGRGNDERPVNNIPHPLIHQRKGSVKLLLPLESGAVHHLANIGRSNFFGELAFLDQGLRSAEAQTKELTELFVLSRTDLDRLFESNPDFALQLMNRLALVISERLRQADTELLISKER